MSASLTDTQTWSFFRSLAIENRLEELAGDHRLAHIDAAINDDPFDRRTDTGQIEIDFRLSQRDFRLPNQCLLDAHAGLGHFAGRGVGVVLVASNDVVLDQLVVAFQVGLRQVQVGLRQLEGRLGALDRGLVLIDGRLVQGLLDCGKHGPFLNLRAEVDRLADDVRVGADTLDDAIYLRADIDHFLWFHRSPGLDRRRRVTAAHGTRGGRPVAFGSSVAAMIRGNPNAAATAREIHHLFLLARIVLSPVMSQTSFYMIERSTRIGPRLEAGKLSG